MESVRRPAVAGAFYDEDRERLEASLRRCFLPPLGPGEAPSGNAGPPSRIFGLVVPHAGYQYSGPAAAWAYAALAQDGTPETAVILGTNHQSVGSPIAVSPARQWVTPLGRVDVDVELADALLQAAPRAEFNAEAHEFEHSIEVQVPFLQFLFAGRVKLLPIAVAGLRAATAIEFGESLERVLRSRAAVIIATTDFSHYVPQSEAESLDREAIEQIVSLNPEELLRRVQLHDISMCGHGPVAALLAAARARGGVVGRLLKYHTSGDVTGDRHSVVGYASLAIERG